MKKSYSGFLLICFLFLSVITYSQDYSQIIQNYLTENKSEHGLVSDNISDMEITDRFYTRSMELEQVYAQQEINDIPVFNAIGSFAIKNGRVVYFSGNFENRLTQRANSETPSLSPIEAIFTAAEQLNLNSPKNLDLLSSENGQYKFSNGEISKTEIPVKLVYQPVNGESIRLAWDLSIHAIDGKHWWSVRVDAKTGDIISKNDWVVFCSFPNDEHLVSKKNIPITTGFGKAAVSLLGDGSQYEVFPLPIESPNHGSRSIVSEPSDATASPYGWHDTNGINGPEFTTTQGNNVWAAEDRAGNYSPGNSPDGGSGLDFIFPLDLTENPYAYTDAATVNLFYMINKLHDVWFQYGFDEASGNFQQNNYSNNGLGNDEIIALAQLEADDEPNNNAFFSMAPEGENPLIGMFTWGTLSDLLTINGSGSLAGTYIAIPAQFGPDFPVAPLSADLALVEDNNSGVSTDIHDACDVLVNAASLSGKIAVIRRGECPFTDKITKAENAGAVAAIVVNNVSSSPFPMGGNGTINIPSIMISQSDGNAIINSLIAGNTINATFDNVGPLVKDGDFDNGIIAHEFGHGISSRLTGGASSSDCLFNDEQMGEGWSDFFGLVLTMEAGDQATDARGYGTYALDHAVNGPGFRQYRYSTDMTINPFTYADVQGQFNTRRSHGVGSVWATMLWDLTWALIDKYGFDPDIYNGTGGNNIAMQLVIDGLKLQPCEPGFVDGRDAILAADMATNGGANQCLIWCVFSRRGLGWNADQGDSDSTFDQIESFDMPPASTLTCTSCPELRTTGYKTQGSSFQIYPNPANDLVNIASHKTNGEVQITLFDINGRKVMDRTIDLNNNAQIDVSRLAPGIYVVKILSKGKSQTEKLIVR